jgi:WD40 repeat protein
VKIECHSKAQQDPAYQVGAEDIAGLVVSQVNTGGADQHYEGDRGRQESGTPPMPSHEEDDAEGPECLKKRKKLLVSNGVQCSYHTPLLEKLCHRAGPHLLSGGSDGMLRWWDLRHGECVRVRKAHQGAVQSLKRSPDGQRLVSCGDDGAIQVWDLESGELRRTLRRDRPYERLDISGVQGLTDAQRASLRALGAVEDGIVAH